MIYLFTGDNSYEIDRAVKDLVAKFSGEVERLDPQDLSVNNLPDLLLGGTLFASQRLIIIKDLSTNASVWSALVDYADKVDQSTILVLVESKPDRRTKAYKTLAKVAKTENFAAWTDRDGFKAQQWVLGEASARGLVLSQKLTQQLVARAGVDQWRLSHALDQLSLLDEVTAEVIHNVVAPSPSESVFELFEAALKADHQRLKTMLNTLELTEEPYKVFGLLTGQVFQLSALSAGDKPSAEIAKDIGAHPFAVSKLTGYGQKLSSVEIRAIVAAFDHSDELMKTSAVDPWLAIERALIAVAQTK